MSMLCFYKGNGQGNKTERTRGSHSLAHHSPALFFCLIRANPCLSVVEYLGLRLCHAVQFRPVVMGKAGQ
jgi:hypothetical protein